MIAIAAGSATRIVFSVVLPKKEAIALRFAASRTRTTGRALAFAKKPLTFRVRVGK